MTNKVKPFYIKITDDMTPQMVQDAFDKCVDVGADARESVMNTKPKHAYKLRYNLGFSFFGIDDQLATYFDDDLEFFTNAKEITLDQLDEWLGLEVEQEWDGKGLPPAGTACEVMFTMDTSPTWYKCTICYSCCNVGVLDVKGEKHAFTNGQSVVFRKPETPEQKAERERLEVIEEIRKDIAYAGNELSTAERLYDAGYRKQ